MTEKAIETYLRDSVKKAGGKAYKFVSPGNDGMPDRIAVFPGGRIVFVELKAPGKKPTPLQLLQHNRLRELGTRVCVVDSKAGVDGLMKEFGA